MDDSAPDMPGFVGVDENCSYGVSRTKMRSKKMFQVRYMKSNGGLVQSSWHHFSKIDLKR
jgi:hypothetical protein